MYENFNNIVNDKYLSTFFESTFKNKYQIISMYKIQSICDEYAMNMSMYRR